MDCAIIAFTRYCIKIFIMQRSFLTQHLKIALCIKLRVLLPVRNTKGICILFLIIVIVI